jgi:superfamily II DNA or RNA helicase
LQARFEQVEAVYDAIEADTGEDYRYQLPSIRRLALAIRQHGGALDASDTGIGKTPVACGVASVLGRDLFVVCPKSVIAPWRRIARLFNVGITVVNYELLRTGNTPYATAGETESGNGRVRRVFTFNEREVEPESVLVVFDDCHKMKDYKTWNCLMGIQALSQRYRVLGASATAADNPMQMKFVALLTGLIWQPGQFFGWMLANGVRRGRFGLEFKGGNRVLSRIHHEIFPARGVRIRVADLGNRFPETQIISEAYDMGAKTTEEIAAVYAEMRRAIAKLEARAAQDRGANILTEQLRARQRTELLKVPTLVDMANEGLDEGMSVVLFFNFEDSLQEAAKKLRCTNTITGHDKPVERQRLIDAFNDDDEHLILANVKCGGVGISLQGHTGGRVRLGLHCPTYSAIDFVQAVGRLPRAGGVRSIQKIVFAANTIEEDACAKVRRKIRRIDLLNDGDLTI